MKAKGFNPNNLTEAEVGEGWRLLDENEPVAPEDGFWHPEINAWIAHECRPDIFRGHNYGGWMGTLEPREYVHTWPWRRKAVV